MEITTLIIIAILVEAIVENIKTTYENGINGTRIIALILAIVICILTQTHILKREKIKKKREVDSYAK